MNENKFEYAGKTYVAIESDKNNTCKGCAFCAEECIELKRRGKIPCCSSVFRADGKSIIFVEKGNRNYPPKMKKMKAKTEKKILVASWQVCVFNFWENPFRVVKLGTARRICIRFEGELAQCKWHFTTRKKARDFARKMNEAARRAIGDR